VLSFVIMLSCASDQRPSTPSPGRSAQLPSGALQEFARYFGPTFHHANPIRTRTTGEGLVTLLAVEADEGNSLAVAVLEQRAGGWNLERSVLDLPAARVGSDDFPFAAVRAGHRIAVTGSVGSGSSDAQIVGPNGEMVDSDDASDGYALLMGEAGDQLRVFADGTLTGATSLVVDLDAAPFDGTPTEARDFALDFVNALHSNSNHLRRWVAEGIPAREFLSGFAGTVKELQVDGIEPLRPGVNGYSLQLEGQDDYVLDLSLSMENGNPKVLDYNIWLPA
jgi:hypothetical protein